MKNYSLCAAFGAGLFMTSGCSGIIPDNKSSDNEGSETSSVCSIASCREPAKLDADACNCTTVEDPTKCQINTCVSGFEFEPISCACIETATKQVNNTINISVDPPSVKGALTLLNSAGAPLPRLGHSAVWTGQEMIIWGGYNDQNTGVKVLHANGAAYNPKTDTWRMISSLGSPGARSDHKAVWTGKYMVIVGQDVNVLPGKPVDGGVYDPVTDTWKTISPNSAPEARSYYAVVAVDSMVAVWGGNIQNGKVVPLSSGGLFDPEANTWTPMNETGAPSPPAGHQEAFDANGSMLVFGGLDSTSYPRVIHFGAVFDRLKNVWTTIPPMTDVNYQVGSALPVAFTGTDLIYLSSIDRGNNLGPAYYQNTLDLSSKLWSQKFLGNYREVNICAGGRSTLWTGKFMVQPDAGCLFNPESNEVFSIPGTPKEAAVEQIPEPVGELETFGVTSVWTGTEVLMFGGRYRATAPTNPCPEGAPCEGPQTYEGFLLGTRYPIEN